MSRRGLSLLEMVVAVAIFTVGLLLLYGLIESSGAINREVAVRSETTDLASRVLKEMQDRITMARLPMSVTNYGASPAFAAPAFNDQFIRFQEPVDHDSDGDVEDPNGQVEYGVQIRPGNGVLNGSVSYHWTRTGTIAEATWGRDINGDNDTNDSFAAGEIQLRHYAAPGLTGAEIAGTRVTLGGTGRLRFLWNSSTTTPSGNSRRLDPIFSAPPVDPDGAGPLPAPDFRTPGVGNPLAGMGATDRTVLINLTVMHTPISGPRGPEIHTFTLRTRATSRTNN